MATGNASVWIHWNLAERKGFENKLSIGGSVHISLNKKNPHVCHFNSSKLKGTLQNW